MNNKNKYDIIYSLGSSCATAQYMQKHFLRITSGPFDWLINVDFKTKIEMILNNFDRFLNLEDLALKDDKINKKTAHYINKYNNLIFLHDFPANIPLEESFPLIKQKYERRINRFYNLISKKQKVLLIWYSCDYKTEDSIVEDLCEQVCKKFNKKIDFLIIEHDESKNLEEIESYKIGNNIIRYRLYAKDPLELVLGRTDVLSMIFSNFSIHSTLLNKIHQIYNFRLDRFLKFKSAYIDGQKYRIIKIFNNTLKFKLK